MDSIYKQYAEKYSAELARKLINGPSLKSFLELDLQSQILGLKILATIGHDWDVFEALTRMERKLNE